MRTCWLLVALSVFVVPVLGCDQMPNLAEAQQFAFLTAYVSTTVVTEGDLIEPETAGVVKQIFEEVKTVCNTLTTSNDLTAALYPTIEIRVNGLILEESQRKIILSVSRVALRACEAYLDQHPEFMEEKEYWLKIVSSALDGALKGIPNVEPTGS